MTRKSHPPPRIAFDELAAAEAFLAVVRASSFSTAAKVLGKSTSSLSRTVAELERQLGAQLLARTTRRLHLTEAGALYATHAEGLLAWQRQGRDSIAELTGGVPRGHLRVTMPVSVGERLIGPHVPELRKRYPDLDLEIDLSDRNVALVAGGFDLAIRVGRQHDSSLRAQLLTKVASRLVASPEYIAKRGEPSRPEDLQAHDCIALGVMSGAVEWSFHKKGARPRVVPIRGHVHTSSPTLAAQVAVAGQGIARIIEWVIRDELRRGDLVEVMSDWSCDDPIDGGAPVWVIYAQTASAAPPLKSRVFVDLVKEIIGREVLSAPRKR
ncbi:MAG TPA: LysR family transcriptional regulator [Kofleriaceae bacterium]|jgi:DNA-binding transcriptional LysR family regulator